MREHNLDFHYVIRDVEGGGCWGEVVGFEELSVFESSEDRVLNGLRSRINQILEDFEPFEISGLTWDRQISSGQATIEVAAATRSTAWRDPLTLPLAYYHYQIPGGQLVARVPDLNVTVFSSTETGLLEALKKHSLMVLRPHVENNSLGSLRLLFRTRNLRSGHMEVSYKADTPLEAGREDSSDPSGRKETILQKTCTDQAQESSHPCWCRDDILRELGEIFSHPIPEPVLLVGDSGIGKSALFGELHRSRSQFGMEDWMFYQTSGARLVSGQTGFGMWQDQCLKLIREIAGKKIVIHLGNLLELVQSGRSTHNKRGVGSFLKEAIQRGEMNALAECTPEQLHLIEQEDPQLLGVFKVMRLKQPGNQDTHEILSRFAANYRSEVILAEGALEKLQDLHRQFATYSVSPGRPLRFLRNLLDDLCLPESPTTQLPTSLPQNISDGSANDKSQRKSGRKKKGATPVREPRLLTAEQVTRAFSDETGLPLFMLEPLEPLDMDKARTWFESRVIGQSMAVEKVLDLLALAKAGLNRRHKPIGSLLFIGPTGVGKTELAKALAAFLFGSDERMIRFDMGEFSDPMAHIRLIFSRGQEEGLLTARVREQPFSVVLLDEFEKASPRVFDLLLQVLGDGRLTDAAGRVADFSNTVLIMTSNLGVKNYQTGSLGFGDADRIDPVEHFSGEVKKFLRPEMFNRIDSIVPFGPLSKETVTRITTLQLESIKWRDGLRGRGIDLHLHPNLVDMIVRVGFDPKYGARPLKRSIESMILRPLAGQLTSLPADNALEINIAPPTPEAHSGKLNFEIKTRFDSEGIPVPASQTRPSSLRLADQCSDLRRQLLTLPGRSIYISLQSRLNRLRIQMDKFRKSKAPGMSERLLESESQSNGIQSVFQDIQSLTIEVNRLESAALEAIYNLEEIDESSVSSSLSDLNDRYLKCRLDLYRINTHSNRDRAVIILYGSDAESVTLQARGYLNFIRDKDYSYKLFSLGRRDPAGFRFRPIPENKESDFFSALFSGELGLAIETSGTDAYLYFSLENGIHRFLRHRSDPGCFVEVSLGRVPDHESTSVAAPASMEASPESSESPDDPPSVLKAFGTGNPGEDIQFPGDFGHRRFRLDGPEVRKFSPETGRVTDSVLGRRPLGQPIEDLIPLWVAERLNAHIESQLNL